MEKILQLNNGILNVQIRLPGSAPESKRFDSCCQVKQVILHGKHAFCQPEQLKEDRVSCYGFGLCSEFDMNDIAAQAQIGELFPKPGVGLLKQIETGKPYDMWSHYEINRFNKHWEYGADWVDFVEEPQMCMGVAAKIRKRLSLKGNTITVSTTVTNEGENALHFCEYQHNFVSIDDIRVDKGYCLEIPYDGTIAEIERSFRNLKDFSPAGISCAQAQGQKILWNRSMDGYTYHKTTYANDIIPQAEYKWTLSHADSEASISEICHFQPWKIVQWGIEHCICTEVYSRIDVEPGESTHFSRTWVFDDSQTKSNAGEETYG